MTFLSWKRNDIVYSGKTKSRIAWDTLTGDYQLLYYDLAKIGTCFSAQIMSKLITSIVSLEEADVAKKLYHKKEHQSIKHVNEIVQP